MRKKIGNLMQAAGGLLLFSLACASDMGAVSVAGLAWGLLCAALLFAAGRMLAQQRPGISQDGGGSPVESRIMCVFRSTEIKKMQGDGIPVPWKADRMDEKKMWNRGSTSFLIFGRSV